MSKLLLYSKLLYELSKKVLFAQVLKIFEFASKFDQPGPSRSIRLEVVCMLKQLIQMKKARIYIPEC